MAIEHDIPRNSGIGWAGILAIIVAVAIVSMIALGIVVHFDGKPLFMVPG